GVGNRQLGERAQRPEAPVVLDEERELRLAVADPRGLPARPPRIMDGERAGEPLAAGEEPAEPAAPRRGGPGKSAGWRTGPFAAQLRREQGATPTFVPHGFVLPVPLEFRPTISYRESAWKSGRGEGCTPSRT